jgi:hypothetical protein
MHSEPPCSFDLRLLRMPGQGVRVRLPGTPSFPLRLRHQHEQLALELSELIHIAYVLVNVGITARAKASERPGAGRADSIRSGVRVSPVAPLDLETSIVGEAVTATLLPPSSFLGILARRDRFTASRRAITQACL